MVRERKRGRGIALGLLVLTLALLAGGLGFELYRKSGELGTAQAELAAKSGAFEVVISERDAARKELTKKNIELTRVGGELDTARAELNGIGPDSERCQPSLTCGDDPAGTAANLREEIARVRSRAKAQIVELTRTATAATDDDGCGMPTSMLATSTPKPKGKGERRADRSRDGTVPAARTAAVGEGKRARHVGDVFRECAEQRAKCQGDTLGNLGKCLRENQACLEPAYAKE